MCASLSLGLEGVQVSLWQYLILTSLHGTERPIFEVVFSKRDNSMHLSIDTARAIINLTCGEVRHGNLEIRTLPEVALRLGRRGDLAAVVSQRARLSLLHFLRAPSYAFQNCYGLEEHIHGFP